MKNEQIKNTLSAIDILTETGLEIKEAKENDGEISKIEWLGLGDNAIKLVSSFLKIDKVIAEINVIKKDTELQKFVYAYIQEKNIIKNENIQELIDEIFATCQELYNVYNNHILKIIEIVKELREDKEE